jgi:hypothetical protein
MKRSVKTHSDIPVFSPIPDFDDGGQAKEYKERRHGEPFKFLFLPKMGLLGSQAVLEKKVQF